MIRNREELLPHFRKSKEGYFFQGWLVISLIGLTLYNNSYWMLPASPLIAVILCIIQIPLVVIYDFTSKDKNPTNIE